MMYREAIGMVNLVVGRRELGAATLAEAAAAPPFALRLLKRSLNRTFDVRGMRSALEADFGDADTRCQVQSPPFSAANRCSRSLALPAVQSEPA
ncbi:hypothetical protein [Hoeflea alexandrii]|uniref:hypothetical protein n=1 Tax=Hoeflea alexandrii TaxID=288436 RepID=UPI0022AFA85E|nr:hypothetical protein [Hoeflea alexandrii]MCZ4291619.1 hypothetical protein [Hoeflea alexandrii]